MPNWKKIITSGSDAVLGTLIVSGTAAIGTSSLGPNENTLTLGARDAASEGGQIGFNAPGGTYTSASFLDNWQNQFRILRGTNTGSDSTVANFNLHTKQVQFPQYQNASSFVGTATANLAVDSNGNIITVSTTGGSVFPYTGNAVITGSLTTTGIIYAQPNGGMYFQGGDDAALYDINVVNTMGVYGVQDSTVGAIKLGSAGPTLYGSSSRIGIGTITPTSASLTVNGNIWATSITGSLTGSLVGALTGTASWATSASQTTSASNADFLDGQHGSFYQNASNINAGTLANTYLPAAINVTTISASSGFTGSLVGALTGTASWAQSASNALAAVNAASAELAKTVNTIANTTNAVFYPTFVDSNNGTTLNETVYTSDRITFNPSSRVLTVANISGTTITSSTSVVSGSLLVTGSSTIIGSLNATSVTASFTGSLIGTLTGTASFADRATSASRADTASFLNVGTYLITASWAQSASNAISASWAPGGTVFPFTGNAIISGSLTVTGSSTVIGSFNATSVTSSFTGSLVGALTGTSSWATRAITSSQILTTTNADNASYFLTFVNANNATATEETVHTATGVIVNPAARSLTATSVTSSFTGSLTGSLLGTASFADRVTSASRADTASFLNIGTYSITSSWAQSASQAISASWAPIFPFVGNPTISGSLTITGSTIITGSVRGNVSALTIAANTASVNLSSGNFFTLNLVGGATTHINPTNINPGQTVNIRISQSATGNGIVSFPTFVDQPSGSLYTGSQVANAIDIISLVTFDSNIVYVSSVRNLV